MKGKTVKLYTDAGEMSIDNIEEYVCGFSFFYCRFVNGDTTSFDRRSIQKAMRKLPTGDFRQIHMKKPKVRVAEEEDCQDDE
jgi:hypothetical protein